MIVLKNTFKFSQATQIEPINYAPPKKILQTIKVCSHFQNKLYKTRPSILSDLTLPGERR